jgi:aryl-phospho-beta-D-glucosidase BglC (GH1 family)
MNTMITGFLACIVIASTPAQVPERRYERLTRGINLSHWWAQSRTDNYPVQRLDSQMRKEDFSQLSQLGFRHVRLCLEPTAIWDGKEPVELEPTRMTLLRRQLKELNESGLAVIVDLHPSPEYKKAVATDEAAADRLPAFWRRLSFELRDTDPERVFMEVMNESTIQDHERWRDLQGKALAAIRSSMPKHTLIASGAKWATIDDLLKLKLYEDRNIVYNFHFYSPNVFTHQGATWGWEMSRHFKRVPYPSSPTAVAAILPEQGHEGAKRHIHTYGQERWDRDRIDRQVKRAVDWARQNGVRITCNEFGVHKPAPPEARQRYLQDLVSVFDKYGIGWAMWDYSGRFGLFSGQPGNRKVDTAVLSALNVRP